MIPMKLLTYTGLLDRGDYYTKVELDLMGMKDINQVKNQDNLKGVFKITSNK